MKTFYKIALSLLVGVTLFFAPVLIFRTSDVSKARSKFPSYASYVELYKFHNVNYRLLSKLDGRALGVYWIGRDQINLLQVHRYANEKEANHVALHELIHWTRSSSRLGGWKYLDDNLAEVVVNTSAAILADLAKIPRADDSWMISYAKTYGSRSRTKLTKVQWEYTVKEIRTSLEYLLKTPVEEKVITDYFSKCGIAL